MKKTLDDTLKLLRSIPVGPSIEELGYDPLAFERYLHRDIKVNYFKIKNMKGKKLYRE